MLMNASNPLLPVVPHLRSVSEWMIKKMREPQRLGQEGRVSAGSKVGPLQ